MKSFERLDDVKRIKQLGKAHLKQAGELKKTLDEALPLTVRMLATFPAKKKDKDEV